MWKHTHDVVLHSSSTQKAFILQGHPTVCPIKKVLQMCINIIHIKQFLEHKHESEHYNTVKHIMQKHRNTSFNNIIFETDVIFSQPISETHQSKKQVTCNIFWRIIPSSLNQNTKHRHESTSSQELFISKWRARGPNTCLSDPFLVEATGAWDQLPHRTGTDSQQNLGLVQRVGVLAAKKQFFTVSPKTKWYQVILHRSSK